MRSTIINKILSFQYLLGKFIGREKAAIICIVLEKTFTTLFGREVYKDKKCTKGGKICADNNLLLVLVGT
jgi:hypothetical protein